MAKDNDPGDENDWLKRHRLLYPPAPVRKLVTPPPRFPLTNVSDTAFDCVNDIEQAYTLMCAAEGAEACDHAMEVLIQARKALFTYIRELEIGMDVDRTIQLRF